MTPDRAVELIEHDVDSAPQDAFVYAVSRAQLARAVNLALLGYKQTAKLILEQEAETELIRPISRKE